METLLMILATAGLLWLDWVMLKRLLAAWREFLLERQAFREEELRWEAEDQLVRGPRPPFLV